MELSLCVLSVVIIGQAHTANIIMYNITILISVYSKRQDDGERILLNQFSPWHL